MSHFCSCARLALMIAEFEDDLNWREEIMRSLDGFEYDLHLAALKAHLDQVVTEAIHLERDPSVDKEELNGLLEYAEALR